MACRSSNSGRPKRCGTCAYRTFRRSSRWTRTATACTGTSSRPPGKNWRSSPSALRPSELLERRAAIALVHRHHVELHGFELRDQPDEVGREAAVGGAGADGIVVAVERRGEQRAGVEPRLFNRRLDVLGGLAGAAARELVAQAEERRHHYL